MQYRQVYNGFDEQSILFEGMNPTVNNQEEVALFSSCRNYNDQSDCLASKSTHKFTSEVDDDAIENVDATSREVPVSPEATNDEGKDEGKDESITLLSPGLTSIHQDDGARVQKVR